MRYNRHSVHNGRQCLLRNDDIRYPSKMKQNEDDKYLPFKMHSTKTKKKIDYRERMTVTAVKV